MTHGCATTRDAGQTVSVAQIEQVAGDVVTNVAAEGSYRSLLRRCMGDVVHDSGPEPGRRPTPVGAFLQLALALAGTALILAIHWQNQRKPIHSIFVGWYTPLYYPLLNLVLILCLTAMIQRGLEVIRWARSRSTTPDPKPDTHKLFRSHWLLDVAIFLTLTGVSIALLDAFRQKANPSSACVGSDYVTFLGNIVSVGLEKWTIYNPAKRLPYPWISAMVARLSGRSFLEAGQMVSLVSVSLIPGTTYLAALPATGRLDGLLAALLVLSVPLLHPFAIYTGSYGLFALSVTGVLAAGTWAAAKGGIPRFVVLGVVSALCVRIQTKGIVPVVLIGIAALLLSGSWRRRLAYGVAVGIPLAISAALTPLLPISYPSLGAMTAINRQEVHRDMPFRWAKVRKPDLEYPSPISRYLPGFLRGGDIESFAAVVLAPPDANLVRVGRHRQEGHWVIDAEEVPDTTIPPLDVRVRGNLRVLGDKFPGLNVLLALLAVLGTVGLVVPGKGRPSSRLAAGWVIPAAIVPLWGPLSLNLHTRYVLPILAPTAIAVVRGVECLVRGWLRSRHPLMRGLEAALITWFCACLGVSLFTGSPQQWLKPSLDWASLPQFLGIADLESHLSRSVAAQRVAEWIATRVPDSAAVYDCTALGIYLLRPEDSRWANAFLDGAERDAHCQHLAQAGAPGDQHATYVVASNSTEFRGPGTLSIDALLSRPEDWKLAFGVEMDTLHPVTEAQADYGTDMILVFRATEAAHPPGSSHEVSAN